MASYGLFIGAIIIFLILSNVGIYLFIKRAKSSMTEQLGNGIIPSLPTLVAFAAIVIFNSSSSSPPPSFAESVEFFDTIEKVEKRIDALEHYSKRLEIYLQYERERQLILVLGLAAMFALPLVLIGLALYKPKESNGDEHL